MVLDSILASQQQTVSELTILLPTPVLPAPPPPPTTNLDESVGSKSHAYSGYDNVAFADGIKGAIFGNYFLKTGVLVRKKMCIWTRELVGAVYVQG